MRYADGPTVEVETHVEAAPEAVWPVVTDIGLPARFSAELQSTSWLDGATGPAPGARFRGRSRHPAIGEWETTCRVLACEPHRVFAWAVEGPTGTAATWRFELEPDPSGTRLRQCAQLGPGPSGLTPAIEARPDKEERIVARRLDEWRRNMQATVDGVKATVEGWGSRGAESS